MSEDQVASAVETAPEDDSVIPNGKGHEPGEGTATSTPPAGNEEKWVFSPLTAFFPGLKFITGFWLLSLFKRALEIRLTRDCTTNSQHVALICFVGEMFG